MNNSPAIGTPVITVNKASRKRLAVFNIFLDMFSAMILKARDLQQKHEELHKTSRPMAETWFSASLFLISTNGGQRQGMIQDNFFLKSFF